MNIQGNVRSQATKEKIYKALVYLLKHKSFGEIYVKDICRIACIHRSSFYEHYQDVNDLMTQTENRLSENIRKIFGGYPEFGRECFVKMFEFIRENKDFYSAYLKYRDGSFMAQNDFIAQTERIQNTAFARQYPASEVVYHMAFFGAGLSAICKVWLRSGMEESPEQLADIIFREYSDKTKFFQ